jgi:tetrahydromethanopterin S-methyltransferase subunit G
MQLIWRIVAILALGLVVVAWGCGDDDDDNDDDGADGDDDDGQGQLPWAAVDVLLVVDNSMSMDEEQQIFATSVFKLVNSLVAPLPTSLWPAADDVRVAVVSTDLGLSWGGNAYEDGDGWPGYLPAGCDTIGDNGAFQTYAGGKTVDLRSGAIPCDESGAQCPPGWDCEQLGDDGVGLCLEPNDNGADQVCPALAGLWAETTKADPNGLLAMQVACLSNLGTGGCGFEQQLQSAAVAVSREDQAAFLRQDALLAVIVVSDEEDCSIEHSDLFLVPEIQVQEDKKVNIACNLDDNEQYLYSTTSFYQRLVDAKQGRVSGVVFGAIVGVPMDDACQGLGADITACLNHADMQNVQVQEESVSGPTWFFKPACNRVEGSAEVTKARPGRRFVSLAQSFQTGGYVYSICNEDWTPAMADLAAIIAERLQD